MKSRLPLLPLAFLTVVALLTIPPCRAVVVTFDDLPINIGTGSFLPSNYQGLVWSNFAGLNGILYPTIRPFVTNGYYYGMVSASNVAVNAGGNPAEISSPGTNFNFLSAYLTGAWSSNLNIEVQGFRGGTLQYDQTVVASATNATLFTFDCENIDRLCFASSGGQPAFGDFTGEHFAMDNFSLEFVPEPSTILLTGAGSLLVWPLVKRKRV